MRRRLRRDSVSVRTARTELPIERYRSIEDMPRPWRRADDPGNLRTVAQALKLYRALKRGRRGKPGVTCYRSFEESKADGESGSGG